MGRDACGDRCRRTLILLRRAHESEGAILLAFLLPADKLLRITQGNFLNF